MQFGEDLSESFVEYDLGVTVLWRLVPVHDDQVLPAEVVGQRVGRIDGEGGPSDDEYICFRKCRYGVLPGGACLRRNSAERAPLK